MEPFWRGAGVGLPTESGQPEHWTNSTVGNLGGKQLWGDGEAIASQ